MSTKLKIIISSIAITVILAMIGISIYLVLTMPTENPVNNFIITCESEDVEASVQMDRRNYTLNEDGTNNQEFLDVGYVNYVISPYHYVNQVIYGVEPIFEDVRSLQVGDISKVFLYYYVTLPSNADAINVEFSYKDIDADDTNVMIQVTGTKYVLENSVDGETAFNAISTIVDNGEELNTGSVRLDNVYKKLKIQVCLYISDVEEFANFDGEFELKLSNAN
ncbi:MAG: hypothetical protein IJA61_02665 [Clostridia bacterium]|nr:hypothetical protein [Clostridia bacterium]